jgi:hypothetical protein
VIAGAASKGGRSSIARALLRGPVYAQFDKADDDVTRHTRGPQPDFFLRFDRPASTHSRIASGHLAAGSTVRGTGGPRIVDDSCLTSVPGPFVLWQETSLLTLFNVRDVCNVLRSRADGSSSAGDTML